MAFFEDWGRKIGDMGQNTMQKTKDVAGIAKINTQLFEEERKLNLIYQEIGKRYVELHGQDSEPELAENTEKAKQAVGRLEEYRVQIRTIKGLKLCQHCGAEIPEDTLFCSSCGKQVKELPKDSCGICSSCGAVLRNGMAFCTACGAPAVPLSNTLSGNSYTAFDERKTYSSAESQDLSQGSESQESIPLQEKQEIFEDREKPAEREEAGFAAYGSQDLVGENDSSDFISHAEDHSVEEIRKFCPNCGKKASEGTAFCTGCGTRL